LSEIYHKNENESSIHEFEFSDFQSGAAEPQEGKQARFVPQSYGSSGGEFILGGFNFDYKGGLRRDEILNRSLDEANKIVEKAHNEAGAIRDQARKEGFDKGREEGYSSGLADAKPVIETFNALIKELTTIRKEFYAQAEREMIDLVLSVAHTVMGIEVERDPALVQNVILKAVEQIRVREKISIRINQDDMAQAEKTLPEITKIVGDTEKVSFRSDPYITRGGCMVETNIGMIDARLESQLNAIRKTFKRSIEEDKAKNARHDEDEK